MRLDSLLLVLFPYLLRGDHGIAEEILHEEYKPVSQFVKLRSVVEFALVDEAFSVDIFGGSREFAFAMRTE